MNKFLCVVLLFSATSIGTAQNNTAERDSILTDFKPAILPYLSLSSSFEAYNSVDVGLLKSVDGRKDIGAALGYIYNLEGANSNLEGLTQNSQGQMYSEIYGLKAYFYYRFYLNIENDYPSNSRTFFDIEPQFYWVSFKAERIGGFACNDEFGDCEYYKFYDSRVDRIVPGLNIKIGKIYELDPVYITIFAGLGYRYVTEFSEMNKDSVMPEKIFNRNGNLSDLQTGGMVKLRIGLELGYTLWN